MTHPTTRNYRIDVRDPSGPSSPLEQVGVHIQGDSFLIQISLYHRIRSDGSGIVFQRGLSIYKVIFTRSQINILNM